LVACAALAAHARRVTANDDDRGALVPMIARWALNVIIMTRADDDGGAARRVKACGAREPFARRACAGRGGRWARGAVCGSAVSPAAYPHS